MNQFISVSDGLRKDPETNWRQFKKSVLLRIDQVAEHDDNLINDEFDNFWPMRIVDSIGDVELIQEDSYNCGPIACMVVWYIYNPGVATPIWKENSTTEFRTIVIDALKNNLDECRGEIFDLTTHHDARLVNTFESNGGVVHETERNQKRLQFNTERENSQQKVRNCNIPVTTAVIHTKLTTTVMMQMYLTITVIQTKLMKPQGVIQSKHSCSELQI